MKYTVKHLMKRALQLADLSNTDFLSHQEQTDYLNDAWHSLFQIFINNGDKQFVKEVRLNNSAMGTYTEYKIPFDCFQIHSLRNPKSGALYTRAAVNSSDTSNTYEVVNNKIRLNGICSDNLVLTYYQNPLYLSFPDKTIELESEDMPDSICGDLALYPSGNIYNLITQEQVGTVDISSTDGHILAPGYVANIRTEDGNKIIELLNFSGYEITTYEMPLETYLVSGYKRAYYYYDGTLFDDKGNEISTDLTEMPWYVTREGTIMFEADFEALGYNNTNNQLRHFTQVDDFTEYPTFIGISESTNKVTMFELLPNNQWLKTDIDQCDKYYKNWAIGDYGVYSTDGTKMYYVSRIPDTECNFPNEMYFQLLAAECAMRYLLKQNADTTAVGALYTNMMNTYKNSLSQNGGYARIASVYSDCF